MLSSKHPALTKGIQPSFDTKVMMTTYLCFVPQRFKGPPPRPSCMKGMQKTSKLCYVLWCIRKYLRQEAQLKFKNLKFKGFRKVVLSESHETVVQQEEL